jgi:hypothetical protein
MAEDGRVRWLLIAVNIHFQIQKSLPFQNFKSLFLQND